MVASKTDVKVKTRKADTFGPGGSGNDVAQLRSITPRCASVLRLADLDIDVTFVRYLLQGIGELDQRPDQLDQLTPTAARREKNDEGTIPKRVFLERVSGIVQIGVIRTRSCCGTRSTHSNGPRGMLRAYRASSIYHDRRRSQSGLTNKQTPKTVGDALLATLDSA